MWPIWIDERIQNKRKPKHDNGVIGNRFKKERKK